MKRRELVNGLVWGALAAGLPSVPAFADEEPTTGAEKSDDLDATFTQNEITRSAADFFGIATEATAKAVQRIFQDQGRPDAYVRGDEGSAAFILGLRYGSGWLIRKNQEPKQVFWRGPSIGFDVGGNASKVFTLVYNLKKESRLYHRFPGVEGSYYFIAGIGVLYMRRDGVTIAPMRTGVGLRAGVNAQYQEFTEDRDWFPL